MADNFHHLITLLDCQCGKKFNVLDRERSQILPKPWQRRELKRAAKKMDRGYVESGTLFTCPTCSGTTDLSKPDERCEIKDGGELVRVA